MRFIKRIGETLRRGDAWLALLGVLGLLVFAAFYDRAFPSAALSLDLSREQIAARASEYVAGLGYDLSGYRSAVTFYEAWYSSVYLQYTLGIPGTNQLARAENLPLWLWEVRWFKPLQKEEYTLSLMPDGTVAAFTHYVLEDDPGADLAQEQALALAETYLEEDRGWDLGAWESVSASTRAQPGGRSDHHFEWKRSDWWVGKSELRLAVDVQGDAVGGYGYWLKVPETFGRHYAEQRNRADFINRTSFYIGVGGLSVVALAYYVLGHRRGVMGWSEGLWVGLAVAGVELLSELNYLPLHKAWYGTTQDYGVFWIEELIDILISVGTTAGGVVVLWSGGRYLARKVWRNQDRVLTRGRDPWIALSRSAWRGLALGGLQAGYVVAFYLVATQILGGWTPMGTPAVNLYATPLPFLAPLAAGVVPATLEEMLFRLIGIGVLLAVARKWRGQRPERAWLRWAAIALPGVLWAFAHLSYVRDPIYLRGIELTLVALLYGWVFWRFDLATTVIGHLVYNVGVTAVPLLRAGNPYFVANGAFVLIGLLAPVVPGAVRALRRRDEQWIEPVPVIEAAVPQDVGGLTELYPVEIDWRAWLDDPSKVVLVLRAQGSVIGVAAGELRGHVAPPDAAGHVTNPPGAPPGSPPSSVAQREARSGAAGRVAALFVAPAWRRQYWASRMVHTLSEALGERGAQSVRIVVPAGAWRLARFWDAQGWKPWSTVYGWGRRTLGEHG